MTSPLNPGGATPTIVNELPFNRTACPRIVWRPPKRAFQNSWLITATALAFA